MEWDVPVLELINREGKVMIEVDGQCDAGSGNPIGCSNGTGALNTCALVGTSVQT